MMKIILKRIRYILSFFQSEKKYAKKIGVNFGEDCFFRTKKFGSEPFLISMGNNVHTASGVQFITHDGSINVARNLYPEKFKNADIFKPILIGNNVFIGLNVIVMPGVIIGDNTIIGAGSVVIGELESNSVYAGVPAKKISSIDQYIEKNLMFISETKNMPWAKKVQVLHERFL